MASQPGMRLCLSIVMAVLAVWLPGTSAAPAPSSAHSQLMTPIVIVNPQFVPFISHPRIRPRGVSPDFSGFPADFNDLPIKTEVNIDGEDITIYALRKDHVVKAVPTLKEYLCGDPEYALLFPIMCPAENQTGKRLSSLRTTGPRGKHTAGHGLPTLGRGNRFPTTLNNFTTRDPGQGRSTAARHPRPGVSTTGHERAGASSAYDSRSRTTPSMVLTSNAGSTPSTIATTVRGGSNRNSRTLRPHSTGLENGTTSETFFDVLSSTFSRTLEASNTRHKLHTSTTPSSGWVSTIQAPTSSQDGSKSRAQTQFTPSRSPKSAGWSTGWRSHTVHPGKPSTLETSSSNIEITASLTETSRPRISKSSDTSQTSDTSSSAGEMVSATPEPRPTGSVTSSSTRTRTLLSSTTLDSQLTEPRSTSDQAFSSQSIASSTTTISSQISETTRSNTMPISSSTNTDGSWKSLKEITLTEMPTWRTLHPDPSASTTKDPGNDHGSRITRTKPEWPKELTGTITVWPYTSSTSVMKRSSTMLSGDDMHTPSSLHRYKARTIAWKVSNDLSDEEYNRLLEGDYDGLSSEPVERPGDDFTSVLSEAQYETTEGQNTLASGLESLSNYQEWAEGVLGRARAEVMRVADTLSDMVGFINDLMGWHGQD